MTRSRKPAAPAEPVRSAILTGRVTAAMSFEQRVWAVTARIPPGRVATYGDVAAALGSRGARAVGAALGRNPLAPAVPCHRVVGADGRLTGFGRGLPAKLAMLRSERVPFRNDRVDLATARLGPDALATPAATPPTAAQ